MVIEVKYSAVSCLLIGVIWLFFILGLAALATVVWFWYNVVVYKDAWYFVYSIPFLSFGIINCGATFKGVLVVYLPFRRNQ